MQAVLTFEEVNLIIRELYVKRAYSPVPGAPQFQGARLKHPFECNARLFAKTLRVKHNKESKIVSDPVIQ